MEETACFALTSVNCLLHSLHSFTNLNFVLMTHAEFTPHAHITLSNWGGIEIMINRSCDGVYYRFNYGQDDIEKEEIFEQEIIFKIGAEDAEGDEAEAGFIHEGTEGNQFYSLSEAIRIR